MNFPSKFELDLMVNKLGIVNLVSLVAEKWEWVSLLFSLFWILIFSLYLSILNWSSRVNKWYKWANHNWVFLHIRRELKPNKSLPHNYVEEIAKPTISQQTSNFPLGNALVIILEPLSFVWTLSNSNNLASKISRIQWFLTSMCLDLLWKVRILPRWITL